jgi:hypothetical protein
MSTSTLSTVPTTLSTAILQASPNPPPPPLPTTTLSINPPVRFVADYSTDITTAQSTVPPTSSVTNPGTTSSPPSRGLRVGVAVVSGCIGAVLLAVIVWWVSVLVGNSRRQRESRMRKERRSRSRRREGGMELRGEVSLPTYEESVCRDGTGSGKGSSRHS